MTFAFQLLVCLAHFTGVKTGAGARCPGEPPFISEQVVALCAENFPEIQSRASGRWVVLYYGTNCKHCKQIAPAVTSAAALCGEERGPFTGSALFGAVDCHADMNRDFCKRERRVSMLPTLRTLVGNEKYSGVFEAGAIHRWAGVATKEHRRGQGACEAGSCPAFELYDEPQMASLFLRAHNVYRCISGLPLLTWDLRAFKTAQSWSKRAPVDKLQHSPEELRKSPAGAPYGENIAIGTDLQPGQVVARWYDEIRSTQHGRVERATPGVGHYTQIVWKSTLRVGCSMAQDRRVVVCHYDPGGNVRGKYFSQVVPPLATFADPDAEMRCGGPVSELQI